MSREATDTGQRLPDELALAFAPLHKRAFGMATGCIFGGALFLATVYAIVRGDPPPILYSVDFVVPLFDITPVGAMAGSLSAAFAFFVAGWFVAFVRNAAMATSIWVARTRAELAQTRDFLDHI